MSHERPEPPQPMIRWPALTLVAAGMLAVQLVAWPARALISFMIQRRIQLYLR